MFRRANKVDGPSPWHLPKTSPRDTRFDEPSNASLDPWLGFQVASELGGRLMRYNDLSARLDAVRTTNGLSNNESDVMRVE